MQDEIFDDRSSHVDRFGIVLFLTVMAIVVQSLFEMRGPAGDVENNFGTLLLTVFVGATFAMALRASGVRKRVQRVADVIVIVAIVVVGALVLAEAVMDTEIGTVRRDGPPVLRTLLAVVTPVAVVRRLSHHLRVTASTMIGAVSAYLLIALAFNYVFLTVDVLQGEPYFGHSEPSTSFMYFSLVTMTTLGYGDLAPASNLARLTATSEAVISQIFLVVFVAMIVGMFIAARRDDR